jgi:hypothetical protein
VDPVHSARAGLWATARRRQTSVERFNTVGADGLADLYYSDIGNDEMTGSRFKTATRAIFERDFVAGDMTCIAEIDPRLRRWAAR